MEYFYRALRFVRGSLSLSPCRTLLSGFRSVPGAETQHPSTRYATIIPDPAACLCPLRFLTHPATACAQATRCTTWRRRWRYNPIAVRVTLHARMARVVAKGFKIEPRHVGSTQHTRQLYHSCIAVRRATKHDACSSTADPVHS